MNTLPLQLVYFCGTNRDCRVFSLATVHFDLEKLFFYVCTCTPLTDPLIWKTAVFQGINMITAQAKTRALSTVCAFTCIRVSIQNTPFWLPAGVLWIPGNGHLFCSPSGTAFSLAADINTQERNKMKIFHWCMIYWKVQIYIWGVCHLWRNLQWHYGFRSTFSSTAKRV